jgi:hypothetical protein
VSEELTNVERLRGWIEADYGMTDIGLFKSILSDLESLAQLRQQRDACYAITATYVALVDDDWIDPSEVGKDWYALYLDAKAAISLCEPPSTGGTEG